MIATEEFRERLEKVVKTTPAKLYFLPPVGQVENGTDTESIDKILAEVEKRSTLYSGIEHTLSQCAVSICCLSTGLFTFESIIGVGNVLSQGEAAAIVDCRLRIFHRLNNSKTKIIVELYSQENIFTCSDRS